MTQPAKSQEPSMEEILASIRRIIADDDASKVAPRAAEPPIVSAWPDAPPPQSYADPAPLEIHREEPADPVGLSLEEQASDILDLSESMAAPAPPFSEPEPAAIQPPMPNPMPAPEIHKIERYADPSSREGEPKPAAHKPMEASAAPEPEQLLSNATSAAVDSAFNALAQTVLVQNGRTLDDLVREMLRPMLKSWLDDNLPGLVERLVRNEIERVARGR
jgi:cell pole-organizing protein PopZ